MRLHVLAPALTASLAAAALAADPPAFPWQETHARVIETGDLAWAPRPFAFRAGETVRCIDFENGDDNAPGTKAAPWKHHPWDPAATGKAADHAGSTTYVFKRGATYRGVLRPVESGTADEPIRLTSDPSWGAGAARFYGSRRIAGRWTRGADHDRIPDGEKVWRIDLDFLPRTLWLLDGEKVTRLPLARTPNWTEPDPQDPMSEWWTWQQPRWWKGENKTRFEGKPYHLGIDARHLTGKAEDYVGGTVWTEWGIVMGSPYPTRIRKYDAKRKALVFGGPWIVHASEQIIAKNRYYLEDLPHMLDSPGEWWFDRKGPGGRLYLRLPGDADPSGAVIEAGRHINLIDAKELRHVEISGLTFRFTNVHWAYNYPQWWNPDLRAGVIRLQGGGDGLVIRHNTFEHVHMPVRISVPSKGGHVGSVTFADNAVRHTDHGAIHVINGEDKKPPFARGRLDEVNILRNRMEHIGWRVLAGAHGHAVSVQQATRTHVAGNMLDRVAGWGISVSGGKRHATPAVPLARSLVHHNRVADCLLKSCDWGAFYITQGGPHYVFNNVAINPVGQMHWAGKRLGYAYYLDGGYKGYVFNNIAAGRDNDQGSKLANAAALQSMISFENTIFNNTLYRFATGSRRQAPHGGREKYLGNVFADMSKMVFRHAKPAKSAAAANAAHLPDDADDFPYTTNAISRNVLYDVPETFGVFEVNGMPYASLAAFADALARRKAMAADVGTPADNPPLRDPAGGDFRPIPAGPAVDRGVKVFVPWALHAPVAEWAFRLNPADPTVVFDEHWFMQTFFVERSMYRQTPRYPLHVDGAAAGSYVDGPLEDWTRGALVFDGKTTVGRVTHKALAAPFTYTKKQRGRGAGEEVSVPGGQKRTLDMAVSNFLIEAVIRRRAGAGEVPVVRKADAEAGYGLSLAAGRPVLWLRSGGRTWRIEAGAELDGGRWHHLVAEVDRRAGAGAIYLDGRRAKVSPGKPLAGAASVANAADFLVGSDGASGRFAGALAFLRLARGTLADADTSIEELYAWQFHGPQTRDFTGRAPAGQRRDAGALELAEQGPSPGR